MEVFSHRLGVPTDPYLLVQQVTKNDKGEEQVKDIQGVDDYLDNPAGQVRRGMAIYDMKTDDPAFRFVAPEDGTYRVLVRNLASYTHADPETGVPPSDPAGAARLSLDRQAAAVAVFKRSESEPAHGLESAFA